MLIHTLLCLFRVAEVAIAGHVACRSGLLRLLQPVKSGSTLPQPTARDQAEHLRADSDFEVARRSQPWDIDLFSFPRLKSRAGLNGEH